MMCLCVSGGGGKKPFADDGHTLLKLGVAGALVHSTTLEAIPELGAAHLEGSASAPHRDLFQPVRGVHLDCDLVISLWPAAVGALFSALQGLSRRPLRPKLRVR